MHGHHGLNVKDEPGPDVKPTLEQINLMGHINWIQQMRQTQDINQLNQINSMDHMQQHIQQLDRINQINQIQHINQINQINRLDQLNQLNRLDHLNQMTTHLDHMSKLNQHSFENGLYGELKSEVSTPAIRLIRASPLLDEHPLTLQQPTSVNTGLYAAMQSQSAIQQQMNNMSSINGLNLQQNSLNVQQSSNANMNNIQQHINNINNNLNMNNLNMNNLNSLNINIHQQVNNINTINNINMLAIPSDRAPFPDTLLDASLPLLAHTPSPLLDPYVPFQSLSQPIDLAPRSPFNADSPLFLSVDQTWTPGSLISSPRSFVSLSPLPSPLQHERRPSDTPTVLHLGQAFNGLLAVPGTKYASSDLSDATSRMGGSTTSGNDTTLVGSCSGCGSGGVAPTSISNLPATIPSPSVHSTMTPYKLFGDAEHHAHGDRKHEHANFVGDTEHDDNNVQVKLETETPTRSFGSKTLPIVKVTVTEDTDKSETSSDSEQQYGAGASASCSDKAEAISIAAATTTPVSVPLTASPTSAPPPTASTPAQVGGSLDGRTTVSSKPKEAASTRMHCCTYEGCDRSFTRKYNLDAHLRSHAGEKPEVCPHCGKSFNRRHDLNRHVLSVHNKSNRYGPCEACGARFPRQDAFKRHRTTCYLT